MNFKFALNPEAIASNIGKIQSNERIVKWVAKHQRTL